MIFILINLFTSVNYLEDGYENNYMFYTSIYDHEQLKLDCDIKLTVLYSKMTLLN